MIIDPSDFDYFPKGIKWNGAEQLAFREGSAERGRGIDSLAIRGVKGVPESEATRLDLI